MSKRSAISSAIDLWFRGPGFETRSGHILSFLRSLILEGQLSVTGESMCTVLINHLEGLSLPRKSVVSLTDHPDMTILFTVDVKQQQKQQQQSVSMQKGKFRQ